MTDPNVIEALDSLTRMARYLVAGLPLKVDADRARAAVDALLAAAEKPAEKPPAPAIMPVRFNEFGVARGDGWTADYDHSDASRTVRVYIDLRPGEDAGVLLAKILAAGGRGP